MPDILARIDAAVGCQQCAGPLGDSPSDDFCSTECQNAWHAARTVELVDYQEPWHRPGEFPGIGSDVYRVRTFRLPPETGDLFTDWLAVRDALTLTVTDEQRAAVQARVESLTARREEVMRIMSEQLQLALDGMRQRMDAAMRELAPVFKAFGESMATLSREYGDARQAPDDPMARALAARRRPNTGPVQRRRPPRRIDARGARMSQ